MKPTGSDKRNAGWSGRNEAFLGGEQEKLGQAESGGGDLAALVATGSYSPFSNLPCFLLFKHTPPK